MKIFDWFRDKDNREGATAITGILKIVVPAIGVAALAIWQVFFPTEDDPPKPDPSIVINGPGAISTGSGNAVVAGDGATVNIGLNEERFREMLDERLTQLLAAQKAGDSENTDRLQAELAEVQRQRNDLQASYKARVEELRRLRNELEALAVNIPEERLQDAQEALYRGDTKLADALFAEIEEQEAEAIQRAAEAAYYRGEIAENEVRWGDAARHYARAVDLSPSYDKLFNAREFAWRSGDYRAAEKFGERLLEAARSEFGETSRQFATALNEHAINLRAMGRFEEAEPLFRQAIEIGKATIGEAHPDYATHLNNLAGLLRAMGRYEEVESLYRQAIEIGKATIGEAHPNHANRLNNLAGLLHATGRYVEAESLYRQVIEIDKATIGEAHPEHAKSLNNLAGLLRAMGLFEEAEPLFRQAIEIGKATIGEVHPEYAKGIHNLAVFLEEREQFEEVPDLYRDAVRISRAALGDEHPDTRSQAWNYADYLRKHDPSSPDLTELEQAFGPDIGR